MSERVTIKIDADTRRRLKVWCAERELTYSEGIETLLDDHEQRDES